MWVSATLPQNGGPDLPPDLRSEAAPGAAHLGAVHLPVVVLPTHAEDLAGLQAAHEVRLAVLLHERRGLLGRHVVLELGLLLGRAVGRHGIRPWVVPSFQTSRGGWPLRLGQQVGHRTRNQKPKLSTQLPNHPAAMKKGHITALFRPQLPHL